MKTDYIKKMIECCQKIEMILLQHKSDKEYNRYFDKMRKYAKNIIDENRTAELLPYLNSENIFIRYSIASFFYNCYPDQCKKVLEEISAMTVQTGLPEHLIIISLTAHDNLKYGIPKDFP